MKASALSRRFSPNDERQSGIAEGLRELCGIAVTNPEAFRTIRAYVETMMDSWENPEKKTECLPVLVIAANKESDDVIHAFVAGKPVIEQRKEIAEAIAALKRCDEKLACGDGDSKKVREILR
jgi:hypothetical protein